MTRILHAPDLLFAATSVALASPSLHQSSLSLLAATGPAAPLGRDSQPALPAPGQGKGQHTVLASGQSELGALQRLTADGQVLDAGACTEPVNHTFEATSQGRSASVSCWMNISGSTVGQQFRAGPGHVADRTPSLDTVFVPRMRVHVGIRAAPSPSAPPRRLRRERHRKLSGHPGKLCLSSRSMAVSFFSHIFLVVRGRH